jgi:Tol biopolymer transport system component
MNAAEGFSYSLLFIPVNGHMAVYDRQTKVVRELPGANLPEYVQTNAFWTPDGKNIIFARAKALPRDSVNYYEIAVQNKDMLDKFSRREISFKFDLYTIPFNNGEGGTAVPIKGASNNGKSNFFPAVSPDGKWLVYCQAEEYMHLMPDSRLYIIPAEGVKPRMLDCNLFSLNSWHAWSPNSKWLVFVSKGLSYYTDMFLTHIDGKGNASIPVLVDKARAHKRVCNYPEFINLKPDKKFVMEYDYVELAHIKNALREQDHEKAKSLYYRLLEQDPLFQGRLRYAD